MGSVPQLKSVVTLSKLAPTDPPSLSASLAGVRIIYPVASVALQ